MLSWICCIGSLIVAWMWAKGDSWRKRALWSSLVMQAPWMLMAYQAQQWGAVWCAIAFVGIDVWGLARVYGLRKVWWRLGGQKEKRRFIG